MREKDYYRILGVERSATKEEIHRAYRKLSRRFHPDEKVTGDKEKFLEIKEADAILTNDNRRKEYDAMIAAQTEERERQRKAEEAERAAEAEGERHRAEARERWRKAASAPRTTTEEEERRRAAAAARAAEEAARKAEEQRKAEEAERATRETERIRREKVAREEERCKAAEEAELEHAFREIWEKLEAKKFRSILLKHKRRERRRIVAVIATLALFAWFFVWLYQQHQEEPARYNVGTYVAQETPERSTSPSTNHASPPVVSSKNSGSTSNTSESPQTNPLAVTTNTVREIPREQQAPPSNPTPPSPPLPDHPGSALSVSENPQTTTFHVTVNYNQTFEEMVEAGKYAWIQLDWMQSIGPRTKNLLLSRHDTSEIEMVLVRFDHGVYHQGVLRELDKMGLRPAEVPELLAFGAAYSQEQLKFKIIALGFISREGWSPSLDNCNMPIWGMVGRGLSFGGGSDADSRFAAVRKSTGTSSPPPVIAASLTHPKLPPEVKVTQPTIVKTSLVKVDYDQTVEEMIGAGKYGWVPQNTNSKHFPTGRHGTSEVEMTLVRFDHAVVIGEVLQELNKMGLRPAELLELLAFNAAYPEPGQTFVSPIIALDSVSDGEAISIENGVLVRILQSTSVSQDSEWNSNYRFAAVRK